MSHSSSIILLSYHGHYLELLVNVGDRHPHQPSLINCVVEVDHESLACWDIYDAVDLSICIRIA